MKVVELVGTVDDSHRLEVRVPSDFAPGQVRIIVCSPGTDAFNDAWFRALASDWLAELSDPEEDLYTLDDGEPFDGSRSIYSASSEFLGSQGVGTARASSNPCRGPVLVAPPTVALDSDGCLRWACNV